LEIGKSMGWQEAKTRQLLTTLRENTSTKQNTSTTQSGQEQNHVNYAKPRQLRKVARSENTSTTIFKFLKNDTKAKKTRRHGLNIDSLHFLAQFKKIWGIRRFMVFRS
jgi:hypothetical protein